MVSDSREKSREKRGVWIPAFALGLVFVLLAALGIGHFTFKAAMAGFPKQVLSVGWNWIFIGLHALMGAVGLLLLGLARRQKPRAASSQEKCP